MIGIASYGSYVPKLRIRTTDIAKVWGKDSKLITSSLGVVEKAVAAIDEDTITMGFEAGKRAIERIKLNPKKIGCLFVGSESHPYVVNPSSTTIAEYLGFAGTYFSADMEFACKAATTGLIAAIGLLSTKKIKYGMAIGADCAQAKPHDILEYSAGSAGAAFIVSDINKEIIAEVVDFCSYSTDTPDFWRRDGAYYPSHGGRFTGEPAYFSHVLKASKLMFEKTKLKPSDFAYCVFHMPNSKFPYSVAKRLGFTDEQINPSLIVREIGNPYSASSLIGLSAILDIIKPNKYIFFASYGSGAGSDAIVFRTTKEIQTFDRKNYQVIHELSNKKYIDYVKNLRLRKII